MTRRGSLLDTLPILIGVFMFGVAMLFMLFVLSKVAPAFNGADIPAGATTIFNAGHTALPGIYDRLGSMMIIGVPLIAAGLAYMLNASAIFFWLLTAFSALFVIAGGALSFLWEQIAGTGAPLAGVAAQLPIISWTMENFAVYALFVAVLLLASIFLRMRSQEGGRYSGI